jgi:malonate transporter
MVMGGNVSRKAAAGGSGKPLILADLRDNEVSSPARVSVVPHGPAVALERRGHRCRRATWAAQGASSRGRLRCAPAALAPHDRMTAIVDSFFPLIALIGLGWLCRRRGFIGPSAARELTLFVVWLALPSLLFEAIANASLRQLWQPQFVVACGVSMIVPFVVVAWWQPKSLDFVDRCLDGFGATYANSGFIGIPLSALLLGKAALIPATVMVLMTAVLVFAVGIVLLEIGGGTAASPMASVRKAARAVARNPLVLATVLGMAWSAIGVPMPEAPHRVLELLAGAAGPCALVSIGALLAEPAPPGRTPVSIAPVVIAKLVLQPVICAGLAFGVFDLPRVWATTAVLLSALPTGTGPFMLAEFYGRDVARASRIMFVTTALSLVTISACIAVLR